MDGTRKYPELGSPITKEHTWYALTKNMDIRSEARNTLNTIDRLHAGKEEGRPKFGYFGPF